MTEARWTKEDRTRLNELLDVMSEQAQRPLSIENLLERYTDFVGAIERGFDERLTDYASDLQVRDQLERLAQALSDEGRAHLMRSLGPLDDRFNATTRALPGATAIRPPRETGDPHGPWWSRVPAKVGAGMERDLQRMGIAL